MHKVFIVVITWITKVGNITLSRNQNTAVKFRSQFIFLSVYRSKIAIIMISVVLIIRDDKNYALPILLRGNLTF